MTGRLNSLWFRLFLGYVIPLALFLSAALVAYVTIQRLMDALQGEQQAQEVFTRAYKLKEGIASMSEYKNTQHLLGDRKYQERFEESRRGVLNDLVALCDLIGDDPPRLADLDELARLQEELHHLAEKDFKLFAADKEGWQKRIAMLQLRPAIALQAQMRERADKILTGEKSHLDERRRQVEQKTGESVYAIAGATGLAVLVSLLVTVLAARGVTRPIRHLREAAGRLRQGELTVVTPCGPAEIAELARSFNLMGVALTEREALLQTSEHRYRAVVGSTATLLWTTDAQGRNAEMSRWCAFTGLSEAEARGDGWLQTVHPDDREAFARHWAESVSGNAYVEDEIRVRRVDGVYRDFLCRSVPILDARGQVLEWVRCCADMTERRQEDALRKDKEAAEAANRAKSEFLARMSHELRTPLNAVIGMSKMLTTQRFGPLNAKQADYLGDITGAGEHLLTLINDILDLSKVEAGRMELLPEPVAVAGALAAALSTVRPLAEARGLKLDSAAPAPDGVLVADPARLRQVLYNLLSNAVKFTPGGGRVSVRCLWTDAAGPQARVVPASAAKAVRFDVEDTGVGIDPKDHALIGSEFYQGRRSRGQAAEGTGLGLALTRRLVELMGGAFWFRSEPGKGSCFSFALPLRTTPPAARGGAGRCRRPRRRRRAPAGRRRW